MRIERTGTYVNGRGDSFFFREGAIAPDDVTLAEAADVKAGAPENRAERPREIRVNVPAEAAQDTPVDAPEKPAEARKRGGGR